MLNREPRVAQLVHVLTALHKAHERGPGHCNDLVTGAVRRHKLLKDAAFWRVSQKRQQALLVQNPCLRQSGVLIAPSPLGDLLMGMDVLEEEGLRHQSGQIILEDSTHTCVCACKYAKIYACILIFVCLGT